MDRSTVFFIHGIHPRAPEYYLRRISEGAANYLSSVGVAFTFERQGQEGTGKRVIETKDHARRYTFKEAYFGDLRPRFDDEPIWRQIMLGFNLINYWLVAPRMWGTCLRSPLILVSMSITAVVLLGWYYGALAALMSAIGSGATFLGTGLTIIPQAMTERLFFWGEMMGSWYIWIAMSALMLALPVSEVVEVAYSMRLYLTGEGDFSRRVYNRVRRSFEAAAYSGASGETVTLVAHSFGAVIALKLLAAHKGFPVRLVTIGNSLTIMGARNDSIHADVRAVLDNPDVVEWIDFYIPGDWLTAPPYQIDSPKHVKRMIGTRIPRSEQVTGECHNSYFKQSTVMKTVLEATNRS